MTPKPTSFSHFRQVITLLILLVTGAECWAASVSEVMAKAAASISATGGRTVTFTVSGNNGSIQGVAVGEGKKFYLDMRQGKIWYDGNIMTSYNPSAREATRVRPTAAEVREANPFLYISDWQSEFTATLSSSKSADKILVLLKAKNAGCAARKAVLSVDSRNYQPLKLVIYLKSGKVMTVTIGSIRRGGTEKASGFRFPARSYPGTEIIDLTK